MAKTFTSTTIAGRNRNWTIEIDTPGTGSATIDIEGDIKLVYGAPGIPEWGEEALPSYMRLRVKDTATDELWTGILAATDDWDTDVRIYSSEATPTYEWHGVVQVGSVLRPKFDDIRESVLDLYVYDGIASLVDFRADDTNYGSGEVLHLIASALSQARNGTVSVGNSLNTDAVFDYTPQSTTGDWGNDVDLVGSPWRLSDEGDAPMSVDDVLRQLCQTFQLRLYEQFWNYDAVATFPRWNAIHRNATGTNVTQANNGSITYDTSQTAAAAPAGGIGESSAADTQGAATQDADLLFTKLPAVKRVETQIDILKKLDACVISRDPEPGTLGAHWILETGSPTAGSISGARTGLTLSDGEEVVLKTSMYVADGFEANMKVELDHNLVSASGTGTLTVTAQDEGGGSGGGNVQFTVAAVTVTDDATANVDLTAWGQDGQIELKIGFSNPGGADAEITDIHVELREIDTSDPVTRWMSPIDSATATSGALERWQSPYANIKTAMQASHAGSNFFEGNDANQLSYLWFEGAGTKYNDVNAAAAAFYLAMRTTPVDVIIGRLDGIFPPERSLRTENADGGTSDFFVGSGVEIDLMAETTYGTWVENTNKR